MSIFTSEQGYTFVEVIVSVSVFAILMLGVSALFTVLYRGQGADIGLMQVTNSANRALDKMAGELRQANRSQGGSYALASATAGSITFFSDVDNDAATEKVTYAATGSALTRTLVEPGSDSKYTAAGTTTTLSANVKNTDVFTYYDSAYTGSGSALSFPVDVVQVKLVGIALNLNSPKAAAYPIYVETKVMIRNL